jgi:hypothetical protein
MFYVYPANLPEQTARSLRVVSEKKLVAILIIYYPFIMYYSASLIAPLVTAVELFWTNLIYCFNFAIFFNSPDIINTNNITILINIYVATCSLVVNIFTFFD